jgi:putative Holliday junction resolvase
MRVVAFDHGARRVGVAVSDLSRTLARPHSVLEGADLVERALAVVDAFTAEDGGVAAIVVGWPRRLNGEATEATAAALSFAETLRARTPCPVVMQDERLTSHEADERLRSRERDWRRRKRQVDAAAAAVILQDYLDNPR